MEVAFCSIVSSFQSRLTGYLNQVADLEAALKSSGDSLVLCVVEGDSKDRTWEELQRQSKRFDARIAQCHHGNPVHPSDTTAERFSNLAKVGNKVLSLIPEVDVAVYCEADLLWTPETLLTLLDHLKEPGVSACVPMIYSHPSVFYDIWAFSENGKNFGPFKPYHPCLKDWKEGLVRIDTAGSCMAIRSEMVKKVSFPPEDVFRGLSRKIYENGGSLYLDPSLVVRHPC